VAQPIGSTTAGSTSYAIANNPFTMGAGWQPSTAAAAALVLEGSYTPAGGGAAVTDPIIYVTDDPFPQSEVLQPGDALIARPSAAIAGSRPLLAWPVFVAGQTQSVPTAGSVAVLQGPPAYELSYTQHCWVYPQRVNLIANPSFETAVGTNHWRTSGTITKVAATPTVPAAPGGGSFFGRFTGGGTVVAESNLFPLNSRTRVGDMWTIQAMVRGTGRLRVGLISWEPDFTNTRADWGDSPDGKEVWTLPGDGFLHLFALRRSAETTAGLVRFECDGGSFDLDNVLCEADWLRNWSYFDGDSTYGARDDYSWYGGDNRKGQTYSCFYNHKRAVTGRLFSWDIDASDFVVTDEEVEAQGFVYRWIPAGVRVTPHLDVLYPGDIQEVVPDVAGTPVNAYKTGSTDSLGVTNPWL
jgi:hypothetical protein